MTSDRDRSGMGTGLVTVGAGLVIVACCAGPALIASGALAAVGGALRNPWLLTAAAVVLLAAVAYTLRHRAQRHRHGARNGAGDCCPPTSLPAKPSGRTHRTDRNA